MRTAPATDELLDATKLVYAAAVDPHKTGEVLRAFCGCVAGTAAHIHSFDRCSRRVIYSHFSGRESMAPAVNQAYLSPWGPLDPRSALLAALPPGQVLRCHLHFDEQFVAGNAFYQGFLIPLGLRWSLAGLYEDATGHATVVCAMRCGNEAPFEEWTGQVLAQVLPHFQQASLIGAKLARATGTADRPALPTKKARLTPAEAEILSAMLQGLPAKAIAIRRGASFNTVRSQIVAILDKTGHHSQRELIASMKTASAPAPSSLAP